MTLFVTLKTKKSRAAIVALPSRLRTWLRCVINVAKNRVLAHVHSVFPHNLIIVGAPVGIPDGEIGTVDCRHNPYVSNSHVALSSEDDDG
jgi:hypothetical protein